MRWKLIILSSLIVSIVSAGVWLALANLVFHTAIFPTNNLVYLPALVLLLMIAMLGYYIYRRTSQRRKTQAVLTSLLTFFLICALLVAFSFAVKSIS